MLPARLSLLDRARTRTGESDACALAGVLQRAASAEDLGYHRVWVAEHHAVPGVAGSAPAVLAAAVLAATARVRVGSGGVMLPNHAPLVVAEQFATLAALHPGRVDLGVGRSPGFTAPVRRALRRQDADDTFEDDLAELRAHLEGRAEVTARPGGTDVPLLVLATGRGLEVAARAGLPVVVGGPVLDVGGTGGRVDALDAYRAAFQPSPGVPRPQVLVSLDVLVAETPERAADLVLPEAWAMAHARTRGSFPPLEPVEVLRDRVPSGVEQRYLDRVRASAVHGTPEQVEARLAELLERTGAEEVLASSSTTDRAALATSDRLLAGLFGPAVAASA